MAGRAHKIIVPTLLMNGTDEGSDDDSQLQFQQTIKDTQWVKFLHSKHMAHWEEREKYMEAVSDFLSVST